MSLSDLIAQRRAGGVDVPLEPVPAVSASPAQESRGLAAAEGSAGTPKGVAQVVTPSGLEIYYQAEPKRLYRIRAPHPAHGDIRGAPAMTEWAEVPSVSTILEILDKHLSWWGQGIGINGVGQLLREHDADFSQALWYSLTQGDEVDVDWIVKQLTRKQLTVNHQRDKAGDRGTNVHKALESWVETGVLPNPRFYPENERGFIKGLVDFLTDAEPVVEHSELMVASQRGGGFAGRFDAVALLSGRPVITKTYPKRAPKVERLEGRFLIDAKTGKSVYESYHLQLGGYEGAMEESGYGTVDGKRILRLTEDGRYELVEGKASFEDFLTILAAYHVIKGI